MSSEKNSRYYERNWNELLDKERDQVREIVLVYPEWSPREAARHLSDHGDFSVSESTVYRVLKAPE